MITQSDIELYHASCKGDREAFQQLAERYHQYTIKVALSFITDRSSADDVAHKAWLNVCRHIKQVEGGEREPLTLKYDRSFMSWLKTVTSNVARDEFRRQARLDVVEVEEETVITEPDFLQRLNLSEMRTAVWEAFRKLSERCRELLLLLIEDPPLSYQAIAEILDRPVGSIGPTRARCVNTLRANLGPAHG